MELRRTPFERGIKIEAIEHGEAVSGLSIIDLRMRIGEVVVRCGGIGGVYTRREYRMKGYARRVLEASITCMREEGYHVSALFGIPNFYTKFGYASALVDSEFTVATRDAEAALARYPVRPFMPEDGPAVAAIYEALHGRRTASIVRDPTTWAGFRLGSHWTDRVDALVVMDRDRIIGYACFNLDPTRYAVSEVGYVDRCVFSTLLACAAQEAVARRVEVITFHAPPDDPFWRYCHRYGCELKLSYPRHGGGMVRIIDQGTVLRLVQPILAQRLQASGIGWNGTLVFCTDLGTDQLCFGAGDETLRVEISQSMLSQWLMGYRSVSDTLFETDVKIGFADVEATAQTLQAAVTILEALFPQGYPYIWPADRF